MKMFSVSVPSHRLWREDLRKGLKVLVRLCVEEGR